MNKASSTVVSGNLNLHLADIALANAFIFTANGSWNNPVNRSNKIISPSTLPSASEIIINPTVDGECILEFLIIFQQAQN